MNEEQAKKLLRLRELRLNRAQVEQQRAAASLRQSQRNKMAAETVLKTYERRKEKACSDAYRDMLEVGQKALQFDQFQDNINRLDEDCKSAESDLEHRIGRLEEQEDLHNEARAKLGKAAADRNVWEAIHAKALKETAQKEEMQADAEAEALMEQRASYRP